MMSDLNEDRRSIWTWLQGVAFEQGYAMAGDVRTRYLCSGSDELPGMFAAAVGSAAMCGFYRPF